jgi:hypothetical protein
MGDFVENGTQLLDFGVLTLHLSFKSLHSIGTIQARRQERIDGGAVRTAMMRQAFDIGTGRGSRAQRSIWIQWREFGSVFKLTGLLSAGVNE